MTLNTGQLAAVNPTEVERVTGIFQRMESIPRLNREVIITEKLDGTNASIFIGEDGQMHAASRTRWITPQDDNYGFARWVKEREEEIRRGLGIGHHFGEWFGQGIQRKYGLSEKRFALFNVQRWLSPHNVLWFHEYLDESKAAAPPSFMSVVPILGWQKTFDSDFIGKQLLGLKVNGSVAVPGFMNPEGIVVYHKASDQLFKVTLDKNDGHKGGA